MRKYNISCISDYNIDFKRFSKSIYNKNQYNDNINRVFWNIITSTKMKVAYINYMYIKWMNKKMKMKWIMMIIRDLVW